MFVVSVYVYGVGKPQGNPDWHVSFHVQSADDGYWGASSAPFKTKEEAVLLFEKVVPLLDDLAGLPSEAELNKMLSPFGMTGEAGS